MKTGEESIDHAWPRARRDHEVGPSARRDDRTTAIDGALQRAHDGRADRDHAPAARLRVSYQLRGSHRYLVPLLVRPLVALEARHSRVKYQFREPDTAVPQARQHALRKRPARG